METTEKSINETLDVLNAIHAEQKKQGKHLRNMYQIQLILFIFLLLTFIVEFAMAWNKH